MKSSLTITQRQALNGQVAFVWAAATVSLGGKPSQAQRGAHALEREDCLHPGEGVVEA